MSRDGRFEPAELLGDRYHPIGGCFDSSELALQAVEAHFRNKHGGGGSLRIYESRGEGRAPLIIEAVLDDRRPMMIQAIYKLLERPTGS